VIPVWGFIAVAVPLVMTPGASTAVVLRNSLAGGTRAGVVTAIGINAGSFCYGVLTAFGFAMALHRWPSVWSVLRLGGVLYLGWLGAISLRRAALRRPMSVSDGVPVARTAGQNLYEGFLTNALNPAIATFYLVVLPQFIPRGTPFAGAALMLTAIHIALAVTWHVTWAAAGGTMARALTGGRARQILDGITGAMLLALAVKLAVT
jgi:threonine/homoserine/homoserine lactone efflux protein